MTISKFSAIICYVSKQCENKDTILCRTCIKNQCARITDNFEKKHCIKGVG